MGVTVNGGKPVDIVIAASYDTKRRKEKSSGEIHLGNVKLLLLKLEFRLLN